MVYCGELFHMTIVIVSVSRLRMRTLLHQVIHFFFRLTMSETVGVVRFNSPLRHGHIRREKQARINRYSIEPWTIGYHKASKRAGICQGLKCSGSGF